MCAAISRTLSAYGRAARMRSWARRIFDAATISIAFVILRVFCTLLILPRISFIPAIACSLIEAARVQLPAARAASRSVYALRIIRGSISAGLLEVLESRMQQGFVVLREFL